MKKEKNKKTTVSKTMPKKVAVKSAGTKKVVAKKAVAKKTVSKKTAVKTVQANKSSVKPVKKSNTRKSKVVMYVVAGLLLVALVVGIASFLPCRNYKKFALVGNKGKRGGVDIKRVIPLKLEVADNDETRLKGLMGRKSVPERTGMLFDFNEPGYYSMWMKDTVVPLDMVFLNKNGKVIALAENRQPMNEDLINPCSIEFEKELAKNQNVNVDAFFEKCETKYLKPVNLTRYVIELPAGTIEDAKIKLHYGLFKEDDGKFVELSK